MSELDEIRQRKLHELQQQQAVSEMKKSAMLQLLTKEARERLSTVRAAHPELAEQVEMSLIQAAQMGQFKSQITDEQLKQILASIQGEKKGFRILRK